jgi:selenocysteine-specific elongation factor
MYVIGTAGHVDHGKTTLIEALTGINPDRLPEEKARGMTIDLGFAWFIGKDNEPIGVIDVPGHERFIRNMVAGAWSLDCALLLVAADDGWMQQTQDHAIVLAALGVPSVIIVITKIDAASPERIAAVRADAIGRATTIFGSAPESVEVSALTRTNIETLRDRIVTTLARIDNADDERRFPYLYVDRVFTMKGSGLVVTGSLKGGTIRREDELVLLPSGETVRVRGLQTYNTAVETASPTQRVALNLQKTRGEIARGNCLTVPGAPFSCETHLVTRIVPVHGHIDPSAPEQDDAPRIRNHSEVEIALGTGHVLAQLHFMDDRRFARMELVASLPILWNQPFLVIRHGGSAILATGRVLWLGEVAREDRKKLTGILSAMPEPLGGSEDRLLLALRFFGFVKLPADDAPMRVREESVIVDRWAFHAEWLDKLAGTIKALAAKTAGVSATELSGKLRIDGEALKHTLAILTQRSMIFPARGLYFAAASEEKQELSLLGRKLMAAIEAAGTAGLESARTGIEGAQKELKTLIRLGLIVPLEGGLCFARGVYDSLATQILAGRSAGDRFSIPEAKERTGLSRKYMIPLLNRMEKDGLLKRDGDVRLVLKRSALTPPAGSAPSSGA